MAIADTSDPHEETPPSLNHPSHEECERTFRGKMHAHSRNVTQIMRKALVGWSTLKQTCLDSAFGTAKFWRWQHFQTGPLNWSSQSAGTGSSPAGSPPDKNRWQVSMVLSILPMCLGLLVLIFKSPDHQSTKLSKFRTLFTLCGCLQTRKWTEDLWSLLKAFFLVAHRAIC